MMKTEDYDVLGGCIATMLLFSSAATALVTGIRLLGFGWREAAGIMLIAMALVVIERTGKRGSS